jgi:hypothetical protein
MMNLLDQALASHGPKATQVVRLVDFWHLLKKLGLAAILKQRQGEALPVHDAITDLENHGERMSYALARQRGLPIGSGGVEAACKALAGKKTPVNVSWTCAPSS